MQHCIREGGDISQASDKGIGAVQRCKRFQGHNGNSCSISGPTRHTRIVPSSHIGKYNHPTIRFVRETHHGNKFISFTGAVPFHGNQLGIICPAWVNLSLLGSSDNRKLRGQSKKERVAAGYTWVHNKIPLRVDSMIDVSSFFSFIPSPFDPPF